jgi:hypothetical protein
MNSVRGIIIMILPRLSDAGLNELLQACERAVANRRRFAEIARDEAMIRLRRREVA